MSTADKQLSPTMLLTAAFILSALPIAAVVAFPAQLNRVMDPASYVVFHNIAEFSSIMVSLSIFGVGWYTHDQTRDRHALLLSAAFLAIGLMDFMHTLSNAAMPAFITPNSSNKSTQFWIAARLLQASAFLASAYIYPTRQSGWLSKTSLMTTALLVPGLAFAGITFFPSQVPDTFIQGVGLTPFKKISEFLAICLLCLASAAYWRRSARTGDRLLMYYPAAFIISIFSELVFAAYTKVFDTYNVLGHIYKVAAFFLIYKGIFVASVKTPYIKLAEGERTRHLASFPQLNPNPVLEIALSGDVIFFNPAAEKILENLGMDKHNLSVFLPRDFDGILQDWNKKNVSTLYREMTVKDRVFSESIYLAPQFNVARIYAYDITERKRMEEALRESERRFSHMFEKAAFGIALSRLPDGVLVNVNEAFEKVFGYTKEEAIGKTSFELGINPDSEGRARTMAELQERGSVREQELTLRTKSGDLRVLLTNVDLVDMGGQKYILNTVQDITERKKVEEEIRRRVEELRVANEELARFNRAMEGREIRMIELKKEINGLCVRAGQPLRYSLDFEKKEEG